MTVAAVRSLRGLGRIPSHRASASAWLRRHGVAIHRGQSRGGPCEVVNVADLPEPERLAHAARAAELAGLEPGEADDAAQAAFLAAPPSLRAAAERKAAVARFLLSAEGRGLSWPERARLARERWGAEGTSLRSLKRLLAGVRGVAPVNLAPALLAGYRRDGAPRAATSPEAWRLFLSILRDAGAGFPVVSAWRNVRDLAGAQGWAWPCYRTVHRRWAALPEAERLALRHGREEAARRLAQPIIRDKASLKPLEWVSLDGRTLDLRVDFGDGRPVRPVMLALVDVASNVVLGHELARSENAAATARLIKRVCERWGIFDRLYTDNGRAFASQLVAGAAPFRFRGKKGEFKRPPGLCDHLGIEVVFAQPGNAQAKIAERAFATLSRAIDDRPEFAGARTGHGPGKQAERGTGAVLLAVAEAVIARELDRYNREGGRRVQGSRWPSYQAALEEGLKGRITRVLTARQSYLAGLVYAPAAVDRWGRVALDGWTYGDPATQAALIGYHGQGRILIGRDPDDLAAPAVAYTAVGELICEGIAPVKPGAYGSKEGARQAARNRKAAREAAALAEAKHDLMTRAELAAALAQLPGGPARPPEPRPAKGVVAGRFGGPLRPNGGPAAARVTGPSPEMERNFLSALAECEARGVKLDVILAERQGMAAKGA